MGAGHSHGIKKPATGSAGARHSKSLVWALALTTTSLVVEVIGAWISGSLALLADAAHMLTDAGGLALALSPSGLPPARLRPPRPSAISAPRCWRR